MHGGGSRARANLKPTLRCIRCAKQGNDLSSFMHVNTCSLEDKFEELTALLRIIPTHIAVITESWLHNGIDDNVLSIAGYVIQWKDHSTRRGGVCTYVSSSTPFKRKPDLESPDHEVMCLWLRPPHLLCLLHYEHSSKSNTKTTCT